MMRKFVVVLKAVSKPVKQETLYQLSEENVKKYEAF